ncbi:MAG TPA: hypothetical protein VMD04_04255, partial [Candidatus Margulisiibacteriota bacterium]|nr:hypothetical protein [Candidatus Margulisiibacteriota bacterium]
MGLRRVIAEIKRNKRFLITAHTSLEGDALGSELAFCRLLKKLGKDAFILNEDGIPYGYDFLPGAGRVKRFKGRRRVAEFDCMVVLDCSDLKRAGEVHKINTDGKPV